MDWFLANITAIFCYSTGLLIAWGIFATHTILKTMHHLYRKTHRVFWPDVGYFCTISFSTVCLILVLFIYPEWAAKGMFGLLVFEGWYWIFATFFTIDYLQPCLFNDVRNRLIERQSS